MPIVPALSIGPAELPSLRSFGITSYSPLVAHGMTWSIIVQLIDPEVIEAKLPPAIKDHDDF